MTIADTIYDTINDNWGNGGYAGTTPTITTSETAKQEDQIGTDVIEVRHFSGSGDDRQINDSYVNKYDSVVVRITSKTSAAQLQLLYNEVEYLLRNTTMTGIEVRKIGRRYSPTSRERGLHGVDMLVEVVAYLVDGAVTTASSTTTDFTVGGDLIVGGDDIKDSSSATVLSFDGAGNIDSLATITGNVLVNSQIKLNDAKPIYYGTGGDLYIWHTGSHSQIINQTGNLYITGNNHFYTKTKGLFVIQDDDDGDIAIISLDTDGRTLAIGGAADPLATTFYDTNDTITVAQMADLLMFGSANAAWVPCFYGGYSGGPTKFQVDSTTGSYENVDGTDGDLRFDLPIPTTKGSLKLYISGSRVVVYDADAQAYVNATTVYGFTHTAVTSLNSDATDYNSQAVWDKTFTAVDCSSYNGVFVWLACVVDALDELNIHGVQLRCYYAT